MLAEAGWCALLAGSAVPAGWPAILLEFDNWLLAAGVALWAGIYAHLTHNHLVPFPAVGIGRAEQICPLVFAWDGFWQAAPTDQHQRLASYALRMLGSAAVSYAALPREAVDRCRRCAAMSETVSGFKAASRPAATPHFVKACLFSACLQLLATRPQYLPAVEGFLAICGSSSSRELQGDLLNAIDALFSAAASAGQFASLVPPPRGGVAIGRHRSAHGRLQSSPADDSPGSPRSGGSGSGLGAVLRRMKTSLSLRFTSPGQTPGELGGSARVGCAASMLCSSCMSRRCEAPTTCQVNLLLSLHAIPPCLPSHTCRRVPRRALPEPAACSRAGARRWPAADHFRGPQPAGRPRASAAAAAGELGGSGGVAVGCTHVGGPRVRSGGRAQSNLGVALVAGAFAARLHASQA